MRVRATHTFLLGAFLLLPLRPGSLSSPPATTALARAALSVFFSHVSSPSRVSRVSSLLRRPLCARGAHFRFLAPSFCARVLPRFRRIWTRKCRVSRTFLFSFVAVETCNFGSSKLVVRCPLLPLPRCAPEAHTHVRDGYSPPRRATSFRFWAIRRHASRGRVGLVAGSRSRCL